MKGKIALAASAILAISIALKAVPATAQEKASFEIVSNNAEKAELRFRHIGLTARRADEAQNELGLSFTSAIDPTLFDDLERALPDWIDTAFGAHDNGVIRAHRPVTFETKNEADGFSLRITPRSPALEKTPRDLRKTRAEDPPRRADIPTRLDPPPAFIADTRPTGTINASEVQLRPSADIHGTTRRFIVVSLAERPDDEALLSALALAAREPPILSLWGGFRQNKSGNITGGGGRFGFPVVEDFKITGGFRYTHAEASAARQLSGSFAPYSGSVLTGSAGIAFEWDHSEIGGEAVIGPEGIGAVISAALVTRDSYMTFRAAYHDHYEDTVEAVAMGATRDSLSASIAQDLGSGFWADGELRAAQYGVIGGSSVGKMLGFAGGLRYLTEFSELPVSFGYRVDADYVLESDKYPGSLPSPFVPLSLRNREVHRLMAAITQPLLDNLWFDLHAGYALDRYGASGPFAGGQLRAHLMPGFQLVAAGRYSSVSSRIGERGSESLFSLSLAMSDQ